MEYFKRILSYIFFFSKRIESELNDYLEINYTNGKKVLDSPNANYSYGSLQKVMNFSLNKIHLTDAPEVLLLGMGAGSVIESIEEKYHIHCKNITAVEIDDVVIRLAKDEFHLDRFEELEIVQENAYAYVINHSKQFDLVIVDVFIDNKVPDPFYTNDFWENISKELKPHGEVIFNAGMDVGNRDKIKKVKNVFNHQIEFEQYDKVQRLNTVLIGHKTDAVI